MFNDYIIEKMEEETAKAQRLAENNANGQEVNFMIDAFIHEHALYRIAQALETPTDDPDEVRDRLKRKAEGLRGVVFEYFEEGNNNECYKAAGFLQMITIIETLADDVKEHYVDYLEEATRWREE